MTKKLTWGEIKKLYPDQWVELIECEWDPVEPDPANGVVRHHAKKRNDLHELIMKDKPVNDAAVIYVGEITFTEGVVFNANLCNVADEQVARCK